MDKDKDYPLKESTSLTVGVALQEMPVQENVHGTTSFT